VKKLPELRELKRTIEDFGAEAWNEADGDLADLANVLLRVIHNFEHRGREYIVKRYQKR